ncbi:MULTISPECIES: ribonuclease H-like domain-containing protein [Neobacillus]|jgi:uncharacterized protein|uniref:Ribonuclease H-like domain-containing protein n=1 Tax=Neobacillus sedimentimangrovi TaxID=2699460 RepID=A0ABS8QIU1_9BACI|nr:ribonuclease H-like domain-containing protein [Neobacillus sedimentimangrovi]AIM15400.1 hypothetical protein HW35_03100 [Bacillus sp. X1(2014)]MCD4839122.1 ribonuclease H-like domain-containing protein [Neobacillus sedimentimangrovi]
MSLRSKISRLKPHLSIDQSSKNKIQQPPNENVIHVPYKEMWEKENVFPYFFDQDYCLIREISYPLSYQHGHYRFRDFLTAIKLWNQNKNGHPLSAKGYNAEELFFFDTETTGLGGGVGNTIFILGYASLSNESIIVRQHILPQPGAEVPLYQSFLERINYKTLVTYNGKAFDWPQVKTRHTLIREHVPKLPPFGHFDLFHAARRLWKHKLERMKLVIVEKEVLGVERKDDIPGFLAPMIYFDFVESKRPDGMLDVLKHNEMDILSLITLYTHLSFQLCGVAQDQSRAEIYEVGRWYAAIGEKQQAKSVLKNIATGSDFTSCKAKLTLAYQYKKDQEWENARQLFIEVADFGDEQMKIEAYVELAKIYEHRIKDLARAYEFCQRAIERVKQSNLNVPAIQSLEQLELRQERIKRKLLNTSR